MKDPIMTAWILVAYVLSIIGIRVAMRNRKPFELRSFIIIYNAGQVVASFYIFYEVLTPIKIILTRKLLYLLCKILVVAIESKYDLVCEPVDYSPTNKLALRVWVYPVNRD